MLMKAKPALISPSDESFAALVESVTDYAIFLLDDVGRVASWNAGAERIKGYSAQEALGLSYELFFTSEDRAAGLPAAALRTAQEEGRYRNEGWRRRRDGSHYWAGVVLTALKSAEGGVRGYLKVTRDLSERHDAAERLRESEERFRAFMSASPSLMFIKDRAGRYLLVNDRFLARFGLRLDQVLGREDVELFAPDQAGRFVENDTRVFALGAPVEFEEVARYADGERVNAVSKFPIRDAGGNIVAIGGIANDISESRRTARELAETAEQLREVSNRLVEIQESERRELAYELHDRVGQNLTALNISLNILMRQLPAAGGGADDLRVRLVDALRLIEDTALCIEDVMGGLRPPVLVNFGLFAALRWYAQQFEKRSTIAVAVGGAETEPRLSAERETAIYRIAQEAMTNVAKHARATRIDIDFRCDGATLVMSIADDGVGFDAAAPGRRSGQPRWGMINLRERARAIGGRLDIDSAPGRGTKITIELRCRPG
ncbi:MAG: PAS domain S-box protein [Burkholderiales bacterium]|nr:PAS domain S-box protein [Burkholderiales bacterium]